MPWETSNIQTENFRDALSGSGRLWCSSLLLVPQHSRPVTEWVEDQDNIITNEALDRQFALIGAEPVEDVQEKSKQVHVALLTLTESESFDICCSTRRPNSMPPRGAALGVILIPKLGNKFCVGVGVDQKERNGSGTSRSERWNMWWMGDFWDAQRRNTTQTSWTERMCVWLSITCARREKCASVSRSVHSAKCSVSTSRRVHDIRQCLYAKSVKKKIHMTWKIL